MKFVTKFSTVLLKCKRLETANIKQKIKIKFFFFIHQNNNNHDVSKS